MARLVAAAYVAVFLVVAGLLMAGALRRDTATVFGSPRESTAGGEAEKSPANLLVLVIGGGESPQYQPFRTFWKVIAAQVRKHGVHVYVLSRDPTLSEPQVDKVAGTMRFPGEDNILPGVLNQTMAALELIVRRRLPGCDAPHVLRTNLSTFWRLRQLWQLLAGRKTEGPLYGGLVYTFEGTAFATGVAIFWNAETVKVLLERHEALEYASKVDDVAFGAFFPQVLAKEELKESC